MTEDRLKVTHLLGKKLDEPIVITWGSKPEIELKPCPFCGGYAHLDDPSEMGDYGVSCENCGLFVMFGRDGECQTKEEAMEAWNRRADDE